MTNHSPDFWRRKARALLVPSPFAHDRGDHSAQESERIAHIEQTLGAMAGDERALIERCMRDAHDAHVPHDAQERGLTWCKRKHPLSGHVLDTPRTAEEFFEDEAKLRAPAGEVARADDPQGAYADLWRQAMERGEDMPGSFALPDHSVAALRSMTAALVGARADGCRAALLYMHIGPVQGFIEASRRTHDLWVGSYTVGYLTMQAIRAIAEAEGPDAIVYPDLAMLPLAQKLLFAAEPEAEKTKKDVLRSSLANRFLAVVALERAQDLLASAQQRVDQAWSHMAGRARDGIDQRRRAQDDMWSGFAEQLGAHLDIDAVVQPWPTDRNELDTLLHGFDIPAGERPSWPEDREPQATGAGYGALFDLCHRTLTAYRKTTLPPSLPGDARPKCSQCGRREQMVPRIDGQFGRPLDGCRDFNEELSRRLSDNNDQPRISYQLARGEGLCAVCWTKRMAPEEFFGNRAGELGLDWKQDTDRRLLRFPGVVTIATAPFRYRLLHPREDLSELRARVKTWLDTLKPILAKNVLDFTEPGNLLYGLEGRHHEHLREVAEPVLAHDGEWFYDSNYEPRTAWRNHFAGDPSTDDDTERFQRLETKLSAARSSFKAVRRLAGIEASAYYAVLVLDVDDMGKWLTGRHPETPSLARMLAGAERARQVADDRKRPLYPALHRELARRLARLAICLHGVVDRHLGRMVYSGGDDVMAFLPLATALPCARAIERAIRGELGDRVTASAGLAVAHMRMPLSRTLDDARKAEKRSKQRGKDRLTVRVAKRSGAPVDVTFPWRAGDAGSLDVIECIVELLRSDPQRGESTRPLSRVDTVYRLEQEFRLLHDDDRTPRRDAPSTAEMLLQRMDTLLRKGIGEAMKPRVDRLMRCLEPLGNQDRMNLLLLLRFLMSEEHGIDTVTLLKDLKLWPRHAAKEHA